MTEATIDMIWWKWRTTYRKEWGIRPPAKNISSMTIESRSIDGDRELIRVSVQIGKSTWDNSTVVFTEDDIERYKSTKELFDSPEKSWAATPSNKQTTILSAWSAFETWALNSDTPGDLELATRLLKLFDTVRDQHQVSRPASLMIYLAFLCDIDKKPEAIFMRTTEMLLDMNGVINLYRECNDLQKRTRKEMVGNDESSRTIWEEKNGLESAEERWKFAKERMRYYGFIK
jgi:hypothetical protein